VIERVHGDQDMQSRRKTYHKIDGVNELASVLLEQPADVCMYLMYSCMQK
jgi:hypothetical protein